MKYHRFKHKALTLIHKYRYIFNNKTHLFKIIHEPSTPTWKNIEVEHGTTPMPFTPFYRWIQSYKSPLIHAGRQNLQDNISDNISVTYQ